MASELGGMGAAASLAATGSVHEAMGGFGSSPVIDSRLDKTVAFGRKIMSYGPSANVESLYVKVEKRLAVGGFINQVTARGLTVLGAGVQVAATVENAVYAIGSLFTALPQSIARKKGENDNEQAQKVANALWGPRDLGKKILGIFTSAIGALSSVFGVLCPKTNLKVQEKLANVNIDDYPRYGDSSMNSAAVANRQIDLDHIWRDQLAGRQAICERAYGPISHFQQGLDKSHFPKKLLDQLEAIDVAFVGSRAKITELFTAYDKQLGDNPVSLKDTKNVLKMKNALRTTTKGQFAEVVKLERQVEKAKALIAQYDKQVEAVLTKAQKADEKALKAWTKADEALAKAVSPDLTDRERLVVTSARTEAQTKAKTAREETLKVLTKAQEDRVRMAALTAVAFPDPVVPPVSNSDEDQGKASLGAGGSHGSIPAMGAASGAQSPRGGGGRAARAGSPAPGVRDAARAAGVGSPLTVPTT